MRKVIVFWCLFWISSLGFAFTLQTNELTFKELVILMLEQTKQNYLLSVNLPEHLVQVNFKEVELLAALKALLSTENYYLQRDKVGLTILADTQKPMETKIFDLSYINPLQMEKIIKETNLISGQGKVTVDSQRCLLIVKDYVENLFEIEKKLRQLDQPIKQVLIEAKIISIDKSYTRQFGLALNVDKSLTVTPHALMVNLAKISPQWLNYQLTALEKSGHGRVISQPSLFTQNYQAASIETGAAVLSLLVTPELTRQGEINLSLQINQDKVVNTIKEVKAPVISTRKLRTQVKLKNEETVIIGGIYEWQDEENQDSLPLVSKIPVFNWLISDKQKNVEQKEIVIFVTAKIL